eukprot:COSAG01_NODE_25587_length_740_cov_1.007800_1_plen_58_part_00
MTKKKIIKSNIKAFLKNYKQTKRLNLIDYATLKNKLKNITVKKENKKRAMKKFEKKR